MSLRSIATFIKSPRFRFVVTALGAAATALGFLPEGASDVVLEVGDNVITGTELILTSVLGAWTYFARDRAKAESAPKAI